MKKIAFLLCSYSIATLLSVTSSFAQAKSDSTNTKKIQALENKVASQQKQINQIKNKSFFETPNGIDRRGSKQPIFPKK
ncbi:MAG: hypothetical protein EAZ12_07435 [Sphingobacteriia bacterium]|nr:MAG: hypothetical protein EAZ12_07435 [Sphingobacteriia bacterium]